MENFSTQTIAPARVLRGNQIWPKALPIISSLCRKPLLLGRSSTTHLVRQNIFDNLKSIGLKVHQAELTYDCCEEDLNLLYGLAERVDFDSVIAAGGGKVLDSGKLLADHLQLPCITVPLSASTCAGWTALSNIYTKKGAFLYDVVLKKCPDLIIFDHNIVKQAPPRTLASGIADALAKWYESSLSSGSSKDGLIQQAVQMARVLRDQLLIDGHKAFTKPHSPEWITVAEGCALTAGLISGIGGAQCRTVAAHAIHNGLTQIEAAHSTLHGEKVGYGILVQLMLEESITGSQLANHARRQLRPFLKGLNLPTDIEEMGLSNVSLSELRNACDFACRKESEIHYLPFKITSDLLLKTITEQQLIKSDESLETTKYKNS